MRADAAYFFRVGRRRPYCLQFVH